MFEWAESYPKYEKPEERIPAGLVSLTFKAVGIGIGGSSGEGMLSYRGKDYPFTISGVNLGDNGVSTFQDAGKVTERGYAAHEDDSDSDGLTAKNAGH